MGAENQGLLPWPSPLRALPLATAFTKAAQIHHQKQQPMKNNLCAGRHTRAGEKVVLVLSAVGKKCQAWR